MDTIEVSTLSLAELKDIHAKLGREIEDRTFKEREAALSEIKELMEKNSIDFNDIKPATKQKAKRKGKAKAAPKATKTKTTPKYKDPVSGATWSGIGRKPKWFIPIRESDFRIN